MPIIFQKKQSVIIKTLSAKNIRGVFKGGFHCFLLIRLPSPCFSSSSLEGSFIVTLKGETLASEFVFLIISNTVKFEEKAVSDLNSSNSARRLSASLE